MSAIDWELVVGRTKRMPIKSAVTVYSITTSFSDLYLCHTSSCKSTLDSKWNQYSQKIFLSDKKTNKENLSHPFVALWTGYAISRSFPWWIISFPANFQHRSFWRQTHTESLLHSKQRQDSDIPAKYVQYAKKKQILSEKLRIFKLK